MQAFTLSLLIVLSLAACGRQDATTAAAAGRPTDFVMTDAELCTRLAAWKPGVSNQLVAATRSMAFYDTGIFDLDFVANTTTPVTDRVMDVIACTITIKAGSVTVTFPAPTPPPPGPVPCGGWFQPSCPSPWGN